MSIKKDWKYYTGITLFVYCWIPYIIVGFIPLLGFSGVETVSIMTILVATAEVAFFVSVLLLGKPFLEAIKSKIKRFIFRKEAVATAPYISKGQHYVGVTLFFLSFLPYFITEIAMLLDYPKEGGHVVLLGVLLLGDALFMASLFILGSEFWDRLKKLLAWPGKNLVSGGKNF